MPSKWKISKAKYYLVLVGSAYFLFMYVFHSSIQQDKAGYYVRKNGVIYADVDDVEIDKNNQIVHSDENNVKQQNLYEEENERLSNKNDPPEYLDTDDASHINTVHEDVPDEVELLKIHKLSTQSFSTYLNVHHRCLRQNQNNSNRSLLFHAQAFASIWRKGNLTSDHANLSSKKYGSSEVNKLSNASESKKLEDKQKRYENSILPFEEPSLVFSKYDFRFQEIVPMVTIYSAYLDDRPNDFDNIHNGTYVRLMSILPTNRRRLQLYCVFDSEAYDENRTLYVSKVSQIYEMCENHMKMLGGFILACLVPIELSSPPCFVTLYKDDPESEHFDITRTTGVRVPIRSTTISYHPNGDVVDEPRTQFTACVSPLFGNIDPIRFIEFIEMSLVMGFDRITFYPIRVSQKIYEILEYYAVVRKVVDIVPWILPSRDYNKEQYIWYHGQLIAVQDCMYRNMALSSYVAFLDIDELLVPRKHNSLKEFMETVDSENICGFQFSTSYFESLDSHVNKSAMGILGSLLALQSVHRSQSFDRRLTKCLVKPRYIFEKGIHHISKPLWSFMKTFQVNADDACIHHYKKCYSVKLQTFKCNGYVKDGNVFKFLPKAIRNIHKTFQLLNKRSSN